MIDEGKSGHRTMIVCAYEFDSIEREATYFCETYSAKSGQDHCKSHIARLLREKFREKIGGNKKGADLKNLVIAGRRGGDGGGGGSGGGKTRLVQMNSQIIHVKV